MSSIDDSIDRGRRRLLQASGGALGLWALSRTHVAVARACEELSKTRVLSAHGKCTLLEMARRLFPHPALSVSVYGDFVRALDARAAVDSSLAKRLESGVETLDAGQPLPWSERAEADQIAALRRIESSEFFELMRTAVIEHLYRDERVWALLGFEGSSLEHGGYLTRGFDDIDWLPESTQ